MPPEVRTLTARQARFLFWRFPLDLQPAEQEDLEKTQGRSADLALIYRLAQRFREMLHHCHADQLNDRLQQALQSPCLELHGFVAGLRID